MKYVHNVYLLKYRSLIKMSGLDRLRELILHFRKLKTGRMKCAVERHIIYIPKLLYPFSLLYSIGPVNRTVRFSPD